ncbi:MAG TPA: TonB-dependent receptor [Steroidobacteraceae bacterium]
MRSEFEGRKRSIAARPTVSALVAMLIAAAAQTTGAQDAPTTNAAPPPKAAAAKSDTGDKAKSDDVAKLSDISVTEDALKSVADAPSASSFGFTKPLLETPRAVSFVSDEQLSLMGISTVEDLMKAVPGVYTTTRYGLQGGVNIRDVQADNYFRGMKRINMQGHARTELEGMDSIEVVKGPPSPIYGMGAIGGYVNMVPKSGRSKVSGYLSGEQGFIQGIVGSYNRSETSFGVGGPYDVFDKHAGFYVFGLIENSDTFIKQVSVKQKYFQASTSVDNFVGPFRLETGTQMQNSVTTGAYMNRVTPDLIRNGNYIAGQPLANLDLNGDGKVSYLETYEASPVKGAISANNQALTQRFNWPKDANGSYLPFGQFPVVPGIPQSMHDYLVAHPQVNCRAAQVMRAMPVGGPLPISGYLPVGFALNPCTVQTQQVDWRRDGSWEREQYAKLGTGYADLVYDVNPSFTVKNQFFYDTLVSSKDSYLPYGEDQDIHVFEDKITATHQVPPDWLPAWMSINSLGSINYRRTVGEISSSGGDFDWRQDVMQGIGLQQPNNSFWNQHNNNSYLTGAPATSTTGSWYDERGLGVMFDVDMARKTNLVVGWRYDNAHAGATNDPPFDANFGTSPTPVTPGMWVAPVVDSCTGPGTGCPGRFDPPSPITLTAGGVSSGKSWSASLSHQLPWGFRPYATYAKSSLMLAGANDVMQPTIAGGNFIGQAELKEVGIKGSFWRNRLIWTAAAYDQTRKDAGAPTDPGATANVSDTRIKGIETEIKFAPMRNLTITGYALWQHGVYQVGAPSGTNIDASGRDLGFQDVVDPLTGKVIFPAEAFTYGGRPAVVMPTGSTLYQDRTGDPPMQFALNVNYTFPFGVGLYAGANRFSSVWANRVKSIRLPAATPVDLALTYDRTTWHWRLSAFNAFNELYFRANISDNTGTLVSVMPTGRWELSVHKDFR